jgi:hypothetical protein
MGENVAEIGRKTREIHFDVYKELPTVPIAFERKLLARRRGMDKTERKERAA